MDLRGLDSQWSGFSDFDIKKAKRKPTPEKKDQDPPPSRSPLRHPLEKAVVVNQPPPSSSVHQDHTPSTTETVSPDEQDITDNICEPSDTATPLESEMPTQQPEMPTQQEKAPAEAELHDKSVGNNADW